MILKESGMFKFVDKTQAIIEVLSDAFALYRQTFNKVWYLALVIMIVVSLQRLMPILFAQDIANGGEQTIGISMALLSIVFLLILMFISAFFVATILQRMKRLVRNPNEPVIVSFQLVREKIVTVFGAMLIITVLVMIGALLFVIPGIIIAILLIFYLPNILFNNDKIIDSLKNSIALISNIKNWFRTFAVLLPAGIIMGVTTPVLTMLMGKENLLGQILGEIVIATLVVPFINAVILVQYHDLRLRKNLPGLDVNQ